MGLQAIEPAAKDGSAVFIVDQDTGDMTTAHCAVVQGVSSRREGTSIAFSPSHWQPGSKTVEGSRGTSRVVARASVAAGVSVLWLFIGAVGDKGLCGESNTRAQALDAAQGKAEQAPQSVPASERKQPLQHEPEWDRAEALARALTSSLRGELDAVRSAAEA